MTAAALAADTEHDAGAPPATDDSLTRYLAEIATHPLLSRSEELRLGRRAAAGDPVARRRLVEANLRLVVSIARRYRGLGIDLLDLVQEGNLGLMRAAERYDWQRDVTFASYATWWIRREICRALCAKSRLVRLPHRLAESATRVKVAERELTQRHGRTPTLEEVSRAAGVSESAVADLRRAALVPVPLSVPGEGGEGELDRLPSADLTADPAFGLEGDGDASGLASALSGLEERGRRILELRFGLGGRAPRTLSEVADELGVSRERARRLEMRMLSALRGHPEMQGRWQAA